MKPDWSTAPSWANYLAMDEDWQWFWYENEPKQMLSCWDQNGGDYVICYPQNEQWEKSLEKRP